MSFAWNQKGYCGLWEIRGPVEQIPEFCWVKCTVEPVMLFRLGLSNCLVIAQWELGTLTGSIENKYLEITQYKNGELEYKLGRD